VITRSIDHRYTYEGKTYPGVTGILKVLDKSGPLMSWAARQTAEAMLTLVTEKTADVDVTGVHAEPLISLLNAVGREGFIKAVTSRSSWKNDEAKDLGTKVHEIADRINRGEPHALDGLTPTERARVQHYMDWREASGWDIKISEAYLVEPFLGYGGTLDILARDRDGRAVLADIKTGKGVYRETVLQLAAYGMAKRIQPVGAPVDYPMPQVDRYAVIHVTATGVREIEIPIGDADRTAFIAAMTLTEWSDAQKGRL
jgi:hypothetical protein